MKVDFGSSPISKIIEGAFYATKVGEVILPEALEELGSLEDSDGVFEDCECLRRVVVGGRCRILGRERFRGCKSLREVVGGGGVTDIGKWAFGKNVVLEVRKRGAERSEARALVTTDGEKPSPPPY